MSREQETETEPTSRHMSLLDEYNIERDPRFKRARKEAKVILLYMFFFILYILLMSYWGAFTYDPEGPGFILGMPLYFVVIFSGAAVFILIGVYLALYYIEDAELSVQSG